MKDEFFSYGLDNKASLPWIKLSEDEIKKYLSPLKLFKVLRSHKIRNSYMGVAQIAIDELQEILACSSRDGKVSIWHLLSGDLIASYSHERNAGAVVIGEKGDVISGGSDNRIKIWNYLSNQLSQTLETPSAVGCLAINLRANYLAAAINYSRQVKVIVWNLKSFKQIAEISDERFWEFDLLAFNDTGERLYARGGLGENRVWEMPSTKLIRAFPDSHYGEWSYSSIDDRGRVLATASDRENEVYLWDTVNGKRIQVIEAAPASDGGPFDPNVLLNHNGSILITAALNGNIRISSTESKELLQEFPGEHESEISSLAISNKYLISGDHDGNLKLWQFTA
ncbi:WD40 repeat domain-containing protein [Nostoc sp.]|uniref:WD40 repeat domain-containing protein n=1 Tax=Nostoc sp. TaxID=1180 RepID=UPI002FFC14FD